MKRTCWDTRATDSIIKSGQKDTEASITGIFSLGGGGVAKRFLLSVCHLPTPTKDIPFICNYAF